MASISETDAALLLNHVDFKGFPSLRANSGCRKSASFVVVAQMAERISYYGISSNMVSYLTGGLGQSTTAAAANLNAWYGTSSLTPILGAFLADSFLGRFWTVTLSSLLYVLGLGILSISAVSNSLSSSECKSSLNINPCSPSQLQIIFFFFSFYLIAIAQGGHTPCLQAFGADQFDVDDEKELQQQTSFFNWSFWFSRLGIFTALLVVNYIQENLTWKLGFGIPTIVMCFAFVVFLAGTTTYRFSRNRDGKFPYVRISRSDEVEAQQNLPQERFQFESTSVQLLVSDNESVEERKGHKNVIEYAKTFKKLVPIWCTSLGFSIVFAQPSTLYTKQGATLDRHITATLQVPAASLQLWIVISIMLFVPIYDRILVPILKSFTKKPTGLSPLQRIGIGLCISLTSIIYAAIIEHKRLATASEYGLVDTPKAIIPMSVWLLAPQYILSGVADAFTLIGLQEFFYDQVPDELKSIGVALNLSILGIGSFLSSFLVFSVDKVTRSNGEDGWFADNLNRAHLDYFYWVLAGLSALSLGLYIFFARAYVYSNRGITVGN